ncbi:MAG: hypothetical protein EXQ56_01535 [Acidobacteria bacterium]|nr:hypothetical protein [Acidobacteriota bacterium]
MDTTPDPKPEAKPKRLKIYSAQSGYVYEYYFLESRQRRKLFGGPDYAYLYHVTTNRKNFSVVEVVVEDKALRAWKKINGRELAEMERYAAAKMGLFHTLDECPEPSQLRGGAVNESNIAALLEPLGLTD